MNHEDNQQFLKFITNQLKKNNSIFYDLDYGLYFYGEENQEFRLKCKGQSIQFSIVNEKNKAANIVGIETPLDQSQEFLKYVYDLYLSDRNKFINEDFVLTQLKEVKNYLKNINIKELKIERETVILIPNKSGRDHIFRIGKMLRGNNDKMDVDLLGFCEVPLTLFKNKAEYEQINFMIPYWEFNEYPVLKEFINTPERINSMNDLLTAMRQHNNPLATALHYEILEDKIPLKNTNESPKNKL